MLVVVGDRLFRQLHHVIDRGKRIIESWARLLQRMTATQTRFEKFPRPQSFVMGLPEAVTFVGLQPLLL